MTNFDLNTRLELIKQVGEEIINQDELTKLLKNNTPLVAYDGFEPSGQIHIAQGLLRAININKMVAAGAKFKMLVADWHAQANNKMNGDLTKIQTVGRYFIEIWKASGMNLDKVEFIWASEIVKNPDYWQLVLQVARTNSLRRFVRTAEIMGRSESLDSLTAANILYSCMQTADVFYLGANITQLGIDQRKINVLAREIGNQLAKPYGGYKPVIVSHHMLMGLGKPSTETVDKLQQTIDRKMSKSNPDSAIFMTDTPEDVSRKINKAYCPEGEVANNPVLEYCRYILFESFDRLGIKELMVERPEKFGGTLSFKTYIELEKVFSKKQLHPQDLKQAVIGYLNQLLQPVRDHFDKDPKAKALLTEVKSFQITR